MRTEPNIQSRWRFDHVAILVIRFQWLSTGIDDVTSLPREEQWAGSFFSYIPELKLIKLSSFLRQFLEVTIVLVVTKWLLRDHVFALCYFLIDVSTLSTCRLFYAA